MRIILLDMALLLVPVAAAEPEVTGQSDITIQGLGGEEFRVKFGIQADETANYTVTLQERSEFTFDSLNMTLEIPAGDSRTFIFNGKVVEEMADGKYVMSWTAAKNGTNFADGSFEIVAGEQVPGPGLLAAAAGIALVAVLRRRR